MDLHPEVEPLSATEERWIRRLKKVLNECPTNRLELMTVGDPSLTVIDGKVARRHDLALEDGRAHDNGIVLGSIRTGMRIHGVSG